MPTDNRTVVGKLTTSNARNSSSASNHDSSGQNNKDESSTSSSSSDGCSSDSDSSGGSSRPSQHPYNGQVYYSASKLLTEDTLRQHNVEFEPMSSRERIKFWRISEEFSELEDDFDEKRNFSKPMRSERVSIYTKRHSLTQIPTLTKTQNNHRIFPVAKANV